MSEARYWGGDIPWVSAKDMHETRITGSILRVTPEAVGNGTKLVPQGTTLCVVRGMSLAKEFRVSIAQCPVTFNQDLKAIVAGPELDEEFLFYALWAIRDIVRQRAGEASHGTKKLETEVLNSILIPKPSREIQARIASIIRTYDDLIENNRRRIKLLEEAARLIYREWFVRLRFPGHEHTKIENGVPEGWRIATVGELGEVVTGKTPSTKDSGNYGGDVPFVRTPDMHGRTFVVSTEVTLSEEGAATQKGKFLPPLSVLVSCIGTVGVVSLTAQRCQFNQQINAVVPGDAVSPYFCYFACKSLRPTLEGLGGGATMPNVSKSKFEALTILLPTRTCMAEFHDLVEPLFANLLVLLKLNARLSVARDLLLPRLMSGEIEV